MSSLLTFQLRQTQQQQQQQQQQAKLGTETSQDNQSGLPSPPNSFCGDESSCTVQQAGAAQQTTPPPMIKLERRDSLGTVFNDMSIKDYSTSLPENYTIEHGSSSIKRGPSIAIAVATATAAATGGLTIRNTNNRRQSETNLSTSSSSYKRKSRLSESYRCTDCGKSYKHPNCLQKHRWEHSEEWEVTKNLSLTKHQQVQMLEAAAILIGMDRRTSGVSIKEQQQQVPEEDEEDEEDKVDIEDDEEESIIIDDDEEEEDDRLSIDSDSSSIFMEDL